MHFLVVMIRTDVEKKKVSQKKKVVYLLLYLRFLVCVKRPLSVQMYASQQIAVFTALFSHRENI